MRVVSGTARGRRLAAPPGDATRPTTDRVREAMFNALGSLGAVADAVVVDLFAGSGALGIEALSRGAASVDFVESDRVAARTVADNLATLGFDDRGTLHRTPVERAVDALPTRIDLVLADPPYAFDDWVSLLGRLVPRLAPDAVVVVESDREPDLGPEWEKLRVKSYGGTVVTFAQRADPSQRTGADV